MLPKRGARRFAVVAFFLCLLAAGLAVAFAPYADRLLAGVLSDLLAGGPGLKPESLEVDLLGRRAVARNLRGSGAIRFVGELRLEGVNLFALVFGANDSALARQALILRVEPGNGATRLAAARIEATRLSGPFPGLLSLIRDPSGRDFGPDALRMQAGVFVVDDLRLEGEPRLRVKALAATDFSLRRHSLAVFSSVSGAAEGSSFRLGHGLLGRRAVPDPAGPAADEETERARLLAEGMRLEHVLLLDLEAAGPRDKVRAGALGLEAFSDARSTRLVLAIENLRAVAAGAGFAPYAPLADGRLRAEAELTAGGPDETLRLRVRLENDDPAGPFGLDCSWIERNPLPQKPRTFFPALEQTAPALLRTELVLRLRESGGRDTRASAAQTAFRQRLGTGRAILAQEFPDLCAGDYGRQMGKFLLSGGELRLFLEPPQPLPLLFLPETLRADPAAAGHGQSLNGEAARP